MAEKKLISLTFDDGPTPGITDQVLDILEENGIVASFFVIGNQINDDTQYLLKRAYDMGCTIENHSENHKSMPTLTEAEIIEEINTTTDKIVKVTGEMPEYFRPPYIDYDQKMYDNIDFFFICGYGCNDWEPAVTAQERIDMIMRDAAPGNIVLLHDMAGNVNTVEAIKYIIPALKEQGYEFVNIRDLFTLSGVKPAKNVTYMGVNEVRTNYM